MKTIVFSLLFVSLICCFGQTDSNIIAVGDWSEAVNDRDAWLRGRLLVFDDQGPDVENHARVYLELQHVFHGGWSNPLEVYFDIGFDIGRGNGIHLELRDERDDPVSQEHVPIRGMLPRPSWIVLPCDSTVRLRADIYTLTTKPKPSGLEVFVPGGRWVIPPNPTKDFLLSGSFTPPQDHPSPLQYHAWRGTLKLPKVKIPVKKP